MLFFAQFMLAMLQLVTIILVAFFIVGVVPYAASLIREEFVNYVRAHKDVPHNGHHRFGMPNANDIAQELLRRNRARLQEEQNFEQLAIVRSDFRAEVIYG